MFHNLLTTLRPTLSPSARSLHARIQERMPPPSAKSHILLALLGILASATICTALVSITVPLAPATLGASLTFTQASVSAHTTMSGEFYNLDGLAGELTILHYASCSDVPLIPTNASIFNPYNVSGAGCNTTSSQFLCKVGDFGSRYGSLSGANNFTFVTNDANLPLFGSRTIQGRVVVLKYLNGTTWACAPIGAQPTCNPNTHYIIANRTDMSAQLCGGFTTCTSQEYETIAPTSTSDRVCTKYSHLSSIDMRLEGLNVPTLLDVEDNITDALASFVNDSRIVILTSITLLNTTRPTVSMTFVAVNETSREPLARAAVLSILQQAHADTESCFTQDELDCRCSTNGHSGGVGVTTGACTTINGTSSCFTAGGLDCSYARNLTQYSPLAHPISGAGFVDCPTFEPGTCLERALGYNVLSLLASSAPVDLNATIVIPEIPSSATEIFNFSLAANAVNAMANVGLTWRNIVQKKPLPLDAVSYQLQYQKTNGGFDMQRAQADGIAYGMPFAVFIAFMVLMLILVPIVLCCMCCCRSCRCCCCWECCGGRLLQKVESKDWRTFYLIAYHITVFFLAMTIIGLLLADKKVTSGLNDIEDAAVASITAADLYKNNTIEQVISISEDMFDGNFRVD